MAGSFEGVVVVVAPFGGPFQKRFQVVELLRYCVIRRVLFVEEPTNVFIEKRQRKPFKSYRRTLIGSELKQARTGRFIGHCATCPALLAGLLNPLAKGIVK